MLGVTASRHDSLVNRYIWTAALQRNRTWDCRSKRFCDRASDAGLLLGIMLADAAKQDRLSHSAYFNVISAS